MSWSRHQFRGAQIPVYQEFSAENSDKNKPILREDTIYFELSWLGGIWVDKVGYELTRASVPRCINTSISEFTAENSDENNKPILQEGTIYLGPIDLVGYELTRAWVPRCINTGVSEFSAENSDENKPILREDTIYLWLSWLSRVRVDQGQQETLYVHLSWKDVCLKRTIEWLNK